jgi:hypothetical protein
MDEAANRVWGFIREVTECPKRFRMRQSVRLADIGL